MLLSLGICGGGFSDRVLCDRPGNSIRFSASNSWFNRLLAFFYLAPRSYSDANRQTIRIFQQHLEQIVGTARLQRVCRNMGLDLEGKKTRGDSLLSREVAQILIGLQDVKVEDVQELTDAIRRGDAWTSSVPQDIRGRLAPIHHFTNIPTDLFSRTVHSMGNPLQGSVTCPRVKGVITGKHEGPWANLRFDQLSVTRERLQLCENNPHLDESKFYEKFAKRISKRELDVGMLVPAYSTPEQRNNYFRVVAKLITSRGQVRYILMPATSDMRLRPFSVIRGTEPRSSAIDAISFFITDLEREMGRTAYESGLIYERFMQRLGYIPVEVGHSIGGTITQWKSCDPNPSRELHIYNAPGVPLRVVRSFHQNVLSSNQPFTLNIRETRHDRLQRLGDYCIGFEAPRQVNIDYVKYHKLERSPIHPHSLFFHGSEVTRFVALSGYTSTQLNRKFNHTRKPFLEIIRANVGGYILSPLLILVKKVFRAIFGSRADTLRGLHMERLTHNGCAVEHITEEEARNAGRTPSSPYPLLLPPATPVTG